MSEELETVLRLVAEGHLDPGEAAPIIEALTRAEAAPRAEREDRPGTLDSVRRHVGAVRDHAARLRAEADAVRATATGRQVRIRVTERGRQVVNLRIPLGFADMALRMVPGIGEEQATRIRAALDAGTIGPIIDVEEDGDGVLISVE